MSNNVALKTFINTIASMRGIGTAEFQCVYVGGGKVFDLGADWRSADRETLIERAQSQGIDIEHSCVQISDFEGMADFLHMQEADAAETATWLLVYELRRQAELAN